LNKWWRERITDAFHKVFYRFDDQVVWRQATWMGIPALKCPFDLWVYQEILWELRPDLIIECGTYLGGSALFLASICDQLGHGQVFTIDINLSGERPEHPRIRYWHGSSLEPETIKAVEPLVSPGDTVIVILDSDHHKNHVLSELQIYSRFVSLGSYLIVEDTNLNGHPVWPGFGPGPMEAVNEFMKGTDQFVIDRSREKFYMTFNPGGYLKRVV
jgi:cephalosporin hydroxylase